MEHSQPQPEMSFANKTAAEIAEIYLTEVGEDDTRDQTLVDNLRDSFFRGLEAAVQDNPDRLLEISWHFAFHDSWHVRGIATFYLDSITTTHSDKAMELWQRLFEDPHQAVRACARETIDIGLDEEKLTKEQATQLYELARKGELKTSGRRI